MEEQFLLEGQPLRLPSKYLCLHVHVLLDKFISASLLPPPTQYSVTLETVDVLAVRENPWGWLSHRPLPCNSSTLYPYQNVWGAGGGWGAAGEASSKSFSGASV